VFDAILGSAVRLCDGLYGAITRLDGDLVHLAAVHHPRPEEVEMIYPAPLASSLLPCRAIRENTILQLPDLEAEGVLPPEGAKIVRTGGVRSLVIVPMRRDGKPVGTILIARPSVGTFPEEQIALLQTFADQAVIAIENMRCSRSWRRRIRHSPRPTPR
jgi:GAF domain-containing protein